MVKCEQALVNYHNELKFKIESLNHKHMDQANIFNKKEIAPHQTQ